MTIYFKSVLMFWKQQKQSPEVFYKKGVLRFFTKFTGKHLYQGLFFNKVAGLRTLPQVFSCEFCEISKNTFSYRTPLRLLLKQIDWRENAVLWNKNLRGYRSINPFVLNAPFLHPLKISENLTVFWCFQGVEKGCIGNKRVKTTKK